MQFNRLVLLGLKDITVITVIIITVVIIIIIIIYFISVTSCNLFVIFLLSRDRRCSRNTTQENEAGKAFGRDYL